MWRAESGSRVYVQRARTPSLDLTEDSPSGRITFQPHGVNQQKRTTGDHRFSPRSTD